MQGWVAIVPCQPSSRRLLGTGIERCGLRQPTDHTDNRLGAMTTLVNTKT